MRKNLMRRLVGVVMALLVAAGVTVGTVSAAHAQTSPLGDITTSVTCGPLSADVSASVTGGLANTSYTETVTVAGVTSVSTTFVTDATGAGSGVVSVQLASLLNGLGLVTGNVSAQGQRATIDPGINCGSIL